MVNKVCLCYKDAKLMPYTHEHDEQSVLWLNDPELQKSFGLCRRVTLETHRQWNEAQSDLLLWAILDPMGIHHGNISLRVNLRHMSAYFQIYLGNKRARGLGLGWFSIVCVLNHAFCCLNMHRVWLHTFTENTVAINLYKKAGFIQEGVERAAILRDDVYCDQLRWSLLKNEWGFKKNEVIL